MEIPGIPENRDPRPYENWKTGTLVGSYKNRDPSGTHENWKTRTLAGPYKNWKTGTLADPT